MGYICPSCGKNIIFSADGTATHTCERTTNDVYGWVWNGYRWFYPYTTINYYNERSPECERESCIYYPDYLISGKRKKCQNNSVIINSKGRCVSYVKRKPSV